MGRSVLPRGRAAFNALLYQLKLHAKERNIEWALATEQVQLLTKQNCFYCGCPPAQSKKHPHYNGEYVYNGLDRVDNNKGYMPGNIVPCCNVCNRMKGTMESSDFIDHVERIKIYLVKNAK